MNLRQSAGQKKRDDEKTTVTVSVLSLSGGSGLIKQGYDRQTLLITIVRRFLRLR